MTNYPLAPRPRAMAVARDGLTLRPDPAIALTIASVLVLLILLELAI